MTWTLTDHDLFNCCTNGVAPDWKPFASLSIGGCRTERDEQTGDEFTIGMYADDDAAEFWTVYARFPNGCCEAITDCDTRSKARAVAVKLSKLSGLPVEDDTSC